MSFFLSLNYFNYKGRNVSISLIYYNRHDVSYVKDFSKALLFFFIPHRHQAKGEQIMNLIFTKL